MEASTDTRESVMTAADVEKEVSEKLALIKAGLPPEKRDDDLLVLLRYLRLEAEAKLLKNPFDSRALVEIQSIERFEALSVICDPLVDNYEELLLLMMLSAIPMSGYFGSLPPGIGVVSGTAFDSPAHSPAMYGADCAALRAGISRLSQTVEKMIDLDELEEQRRRDRRQQHQRENPICAGQSRRSRRESRRLGMVSYGFTRSVDGYCPTYRTWYGATMAARSLMQPGGEVYRID